MPDSYIFDPFRLDLRGGELLRDNLGVALEPKVFALLSYLVTQRGRLVGRRELLDAIWPDAHVTDASLSQAVASLRTALGDDPRNPRYIDTLPRRGYKFIAEVKEESETIAGELSYHVVFGLQDFVLGPGEHVIGRAHDAAVRINSGEVSPDELTHHTALLVLPDGSQCIVPEDGLTIGRRADSGLELEDPQVSRRQANVFYREGALHVADLGSMNGTVVSGERLVDRHELREGDEIRLGTIVLTFHTSGGSKSSVTTPLGTKDEANG